MNSRRGTDPVGNRFCPFKMANGVCGLTTQFLHIAGINLQPEVCFIGERSMHWIVQHRLKLLLDSGEQLESILRPGRRLILKVIDLNRPSEGVKE